LVNFDRSAALRFHPDHSARQGNWRIEQSKSPTDGASLVNAANLVGDTVLILRCKDQTTEAALSTKYNWLGSRSVDVTLRINDEKPLKAVWRVSIDGNAAFAPNAVAFIQSLPDNGRLTMRTTRSDGKAKEATFDLGAVSDARSKISRACNWNDTANEPVGSVSLRFSSLNSPFSIGLDAAKVDTSPSAGVTGTL